MRFKNMVVQNQEQRTFNGKKLRKYDVVVNGVLWTPDKIKQLLETNDKAVCRAISVIYEYQTDIEKSMQATIEYNGVGFGGADVELLSSYAKGIKQYGGLTPKQMVWARKKIKKYVKQLIRHMQRQQMVEVA